MDIHPKQNLVKAFENEIHFTNERGREDELDILPTRFWKNFLEKS